MHWHLNYNYHTFKHPSFHLFNSLDWSCRLEALQARNSTRQWTCLAKYNLGWDFWRTTHTQIMMQRKKNKLLSVLPCFYDILFLIHLYSFVSKSSLCIDELWKKWIMSCFVWALAFFFLSFFLALPLPFCIRTLFFFDWRREVQVDLVWC